MADSRITINGQHYDSPEAMPPDVRRAYEEAMRTLGPGLAKGGSTRLLTEHSGRLGGDVVVNHVVTVNQRTYGSIDELPPHVRRICEDALRSATSPVTRPETSVHVSVETTGSGAAPTRTGLRETSDLESTIRGIPEAVATLVILGLIAWYLLGR
jgi:hypothetical protein